MEKMSFRQKLLTIAIVGIGILLLKGILVETVLIAQAAEMPAIIELEVATTSDGMGVIAKCSYQNYTVQSGCEMILYLYRVENGRESIETQTILSYAEQGSTNTESRQVAEGMYRASVTIDNGIDIKQINSQTIYKVKKVDGNYEVSKESESAVQMIMGQEAEQASSCAHDCEYVLAQQATAIEDATQAYQCVRCGAILKYIEVPNSAYAAFLKETAALIQNAQLGTVTVSTDRWLSFNREVFEAIRSRPDIMVVVNYWYMGESYSLIIPAGTEVDTLMDENGFGGFRHIEEVISIMMN